MRLLFIADIVDRVGREAVERRLAHLRELHRIDLVIANAENVAGGVGITERLGESLLATGIDCITLGNHTWRQKGIGPFLEREPRIVRPANYLASLPGRGTTVVEARDGTRVGVCNLLGVFGLEPACSPFEIASRLIEDLRERAPIVIVDFHAEATSEKVAMGRHLAGRVTAVLGTHTHVQTNDAQLLTGTAYVTDCGMTGPHDSVIGVKTELVLRRFLTQQPVRFEPAIGDVRIEGAIVDCDPATGRATAIELFRERL